MTYEVSNMTVSEAIKKYGLTLQTHNCFGEPLRNKVYTREEMKNGTKTVYTVEQDEFSMEEGDDFWYLMIEKFYYNKPLVNKLGMEYGIRTKSKMFELKIG